LSQSQTVVEFLQVPGAKVAVLFYEGCEAERKNKRTDVVIDGSLKNGEVARKRTSLSFDTRVARSPASFLVHKLCSTVRDECVACLI